MTIKMILLELQRRYITTIFRLLGFPVYAVKVRADNYLVHLTCPIGSVVDHGGLHARVRISGFQLRGSADLAYFWFELKRG